VILSDAPATIDVMALIVAAEWEAVAVEAVCAVSIATAAAVVIDADIMVWEIITLCLVTEDHHLK